MRLKLRVANFVAATVAVMAAITVGSAGMPASASPVPSAAAQRADAVGMPVLLVNGDRLIIRSAPDGQTAITDLPAVVGRDSLVSLHLGSHTDEIPTDALPYLGRGLDPSLFDLSVLQRAESGGRLPVQLTFRGHRPRLPGVTISRSGQGKARGYLTAASATAFGAALERQFRADHAQGSDRSGGLFAGGVSIAVAGTPAAAPPARPDYPMHTLTVTGRNLSGKPDNGDLAWVINAGNQAAFGDFNDTVNSFYHGVAKFSVPAGHYWVVGEFDSVDRDGSFVTRLDVLPEVMVRHNTTVHTVARAATSKVTMVTPRSAVPNTVRFTAAFGDRRGSVFSIGWYDAPGSVWVSPTARKPAVGTLHTYAFEQLVSPTGAPGIPYAYNLDFADRSGTIRAQHYVVRPSNLADVTERYYQDVPSTGDWVASVYSPDQGEQGFALGGLHLPGLQLQYFSTAPGLMWDSQYDSFGFLSGAQQEDDTHTLSPGRKVENWNRYPLHPQPDVAEGAAGDRLFPLIPGATRAGNKLTLTIQPFSDNQPGHQGNGNAAKVTSRYEVDQNGVRISRGSAWPNGIPPVTLTRSPSVVRFTLDAARTGPAYQLSTRSHTVWTWRSRRQPGASVPPSWYCSLQVLRGLTVYSRRCAVQPMMTLSYQVRRLALNGTVPAGPQLIDLHAGHIQLAAAARVTHAAAQVSCDNGKSWKQAVVRSAAAGDFRMAFSAPRGCQLALRVSAADAAGGSITETIQHAYKIVS